MSQWLQCLKVTWSPFVTFSASFLQIKPMGSWQWRSQVAPVSHFQWFYSSGTTTIEYEIPGISCSIASHQSPALHGAHAFTALLPTHLWLMLACPAAPLNPPMAFAGPPATPLPHLLTLAPSCSTFVASMPFALAWVSSCLITHMVLGLEWTTRIAKIVISKWYGPNCCCKAKTTYCI